MFLFESHEGRFIFLFLIVFIIVAISWIGFGRHTMARVERNLMDEGLQRPAPWDGVGLRIMFYAFIVAFPGGSHQANPLYHYLSDIKRHTTDFDRKLGLVFVVSTHVMIVLALLGVWLFDVD